MCKRVEVGAQADRALTRPLALQRADDAGLGDPFRDLDAPAAQAVGDELGRSHLLEAHLRMAMDVATDRDQVRLVTLQFLEHRSFHRFASQRASSPTTAGLIAKQSSGHISPVRLFPFGDARKRPS